MSKQTFTTGQVLTAAQLTNLQQTAMLGGDAVTKTANYVLVAADAGSTVAMTSTSATTVTVNTGLFAAGDTVFIQNRGSGNLTVTAGTATVATAGSLILPQNDAGILYFTTTGASIFYDFIQVGAASPLTTKGDLYGFGTSDDRIPIGANNTVLTADSNETLGLKWAAPAGGSGLTLITPTSIANSGGSASLTGALTVATGVTSVSINGVFSATYTNYLIEVFELSAVSAGGVATRLRAAGVDTSGSNYQYAQNVVTYAGVGSVGGLTTASNWDVGTGSVLNVSASSIFLFNPFASTKTNYHSVHSRNVAYGASGGMQTDSTSFDGISFIGGGTDISLSVLVYGFAK